MIDPAAFSDPPERTDRLAEPGFDDAVLLARELLGAPASLLGLVEGGHLQIVARLGIDGAVDDARIERLLGQPDLVVVPDRAMGPDAGGGPAFRFLAALRLDTDDGVPLGVLCVLDTAPRPGLTPGQEAGFRALGRQALGLVEARTALVRQRWVQAARDTTTVRLGESALLLRLAIEATGIGIWDYDPVADHLDCDQAARALLGLGPARPASLARSFLRAIHPDERARAAADLRASLDPAGDGGLAGEYRLARPDGGVRWVAVRGRPVVAGGRATRIVGSVRDVTARKSADLASEALRERYRLIARATNDAIRDWDLVTDTVTWNEALQTAYGWDPDGAAATGAWWLAQIHPADRAQVEAALGAAIAGRSEAWSLEYRFLRADGRHADVLDRSYVIRGRHGTPLRMVGAMLDLTERNRVEAGFRAIFEGANVGIIQLDPHTLEALRVNAKLCAIWGRRPRRSSAAPSRSGRPRRTWPSATPCTRASPAARSCARPWRSAIAVPTAGSSGAGSTSSRRCSATASRPRR